jgi:hypothetical protein
MRVLHVALQQLHRVRHAKPSSDSMVIPSMVKPMRLSAIVVAIGSTACRDD